MPRGVDDLPNAIRALGEAREVLVRATQVPDSLDAQSGAVKRNAFLLQQHGTVYTGEDACGRCRAVTAANEQKFGQWLGCVGYRSISNGACANCAYAKRQGGCSRRRNYGAGLEELRRLSVKSHDPIDASDQVREDLRIRHELTLARKRVWALEKALNNNWAHDFGVERPLDLGDELQIARAQRAYEEEVEEGEMTELFGPEDSVLDVDRYLVDADRYLNPHLAGLKNGGRGGPGRRLRLSLGRPLDLVDTEKEEDGDGQEEVVALTRTTPLAQAARPSLGATAGGAGPSPSSGSARKRKLTDVKSSMKRLNVAVPGEGDSDRESS